MPQSRNSATAVSGGRKVAKKTVKKVAPKRTPEAGIIDRDYVGNQEPPTYIDVDDFRPDEDISCWVCQQCGAMVLDSDLHTTMHTTLNAVANYDGTQVPG